MRDKYHHGNLKQEIIEKSIEVISKEGYDHVSLRQIASRCNVSHNAIYRHFENKEDLLKACQNYVTVCLINHMKAHLIEKGTPRENIKNLIFSYIEFYQKHPTYYSPMYRNSSFEIQLTMEEKENNYPPFDLFRKQFYILEKQENISKEIDLIRLWAMIHGLISMIISKQIIWDKDWQKCLKEIEKEL